MPVARLSQRQWVAHYAAIARASRPYEHGVGAIEHAVGAGFVTPGDVLAYRQVWNDYVVGVANLCRQAYDAWHAASTGGTPGTTLNLSQFATPPDAATLEIWANTHAENWWAINNQWNAFANDSDSDIVLGASQILQAYQTAVLEVGRNIVPRIQKDCPDLQIPDPPSFDAQSEVIGQIEGLGILAHGVLQLIGIGIGGALKTFGAIGDKFNKVLPDASGLEFIAGALAIGAVALAVRAFAK